MGKSTDNKEHSFIRNLFYKKEFKRLADMDFFEYIDYQEQKKYSCVYVHVNPHTLEPFYVGIGGVHRGWDFQQRSKSWLYHVYQMEAEPLVVIVARGLQRDEAYELEKYLISHFGRRRTGEGNLLNWSEGGAWSGRK